MKKAKISTLAQLRRQVVDLTGALQRERADADNIRRRAQDERAQVINFAKALVLRELLPAIDNLERALNHTPKELTGSNYVKGVQAVAKDFDKALAELGLERIKTVGEHFDPRYHEAISVEGAGSSQEIVSQEVQAGYKLGDEIIRHATVKVKKEK